MRVVQKVLNFSVGFISDDRSDSVSLPVSIELIRVKESEDMFSFCRLHVLPPSHHRRAQNNSNNEKNPHKSRKRNYFSSTLTFVTLIFVETSKVSGEDARPRILRRPRSAVPTTVFYVTVPY